MTTTKATMIQSSGVTSGAERSGMARWPLVGGGAAVYHRSSPLVNEITAERRRRLTHRALPALGGLAGVALVAGAFVGSTATSGSERTAASFVEAWERGDLRDMHALLSDSARQDWPLKRFRNLYRRAANTATQSGVEAEGAEGERDGQVVVGVVVDTRVFGELRGELLVPVSDERVEWRPRLVFPELRDGERLTRESVPAERATLLSRNRRVLARGQAGERSSPLTGIADSIAGSMEPEETAAEREGLYAAGFPRDWPVGQSGLEEAFEDRLRGRPGGELRAGRRALARAQPRPPNRCARRSTPASRRPRWWHLPGASVASPRWIPQTARCLPWRASRSRRRSRPAPPSRSSPRPRRWSRTWSSPPPNSPSRAPPRSTASSSRTLTASSVGGASRKLRPLLQLGVRAARRRGGSRAPRGRCRALRLEREGDHPGRGAEHPAARVGDRHPARDRLDRHRAVQGAGHAAPARLSRPGNSRGRRPLRAHPRGGRGDPARAGDEA